MQQAYLRAHMSAGAKASENANDVAPRVRARVLYKGAAQREKRPQERSVQH